MTIGTLTFIMFCAVAATGCPPRHPPHTPQPLNADAPRTSLEPPPDALVPAASRSGREA